MRETEIETEREKKRRIKVRKVREKRVWEVRNMEIHIHTDKHQE